MCVESKFENKYKNYKEEFTELLDEVVEGSLPVLPEMRAELDEVYTQAAKADEYEKSKHRTHVNDRKAEAFDAILKSYDEALSEGHMADEVCNIIEKYESGEYDAEKR